MQHSIHVAAISRVCTAVAEEEIIVGEIEIAVGYYIRYSRNTMDVCFNRVL